MKHNWVLVELTEDTAWKPSQLHITNLAGVSTQHLYCHASRRDIQSYLPSVFSYTKNGDAQEHF